MSEKCQFRKSSDSIDHLVGDRKDARRNGQAEGPGGLEVDHQLELGCLLDWDVGDLAAAEEFARWLAGALSEQCTPMEQATV